MANYNYTPLNGGQYLDMEGLTTFWTLLKQYISTENSKQNGTNIFINDNSSISITDKINEMLQSIQNIDGKINGVSNSYVSSIKGVGGDYIKLTPTDVTKGDVIITIDDSDLKDFIDSTSTEKKVKSLSIEGDDDIDVTIESDDNDTTNGYVGNISVKIDSSKLSGRVSSLETDTVKGVSATDSKDGGNDYVNISSSEADSIVSITLNDQKLSQAIGDINDEISGVKLSIQQSYGNTVHSIGGLKGDVLLSTSTEAGAISFSTNDNTISGNVVGLGNAAYDNFIECTEEQIKAIIGEIPSGPNPGAGGEMASPDDIGGLFPTEE